MKLKEDNLHLGSNGMTFIKAKTLRHAMTEAEIVLWDALKNGKLNGFKFRRQHPILRFIADFYCHEAKLVVEVDGEIHNDLTNTERDEGRTLELNEYGIRIIRFTNDEVSNNLNEVLKRIHFEINNAIINNISS
jgi:very-short-patch-repair endonuclease